MISCVVKDKTTNNVVKPGGRWRYYRSVGAFQPSTPDKPVQVDAGNQVNGMPKEARQILTALANTSANAPKPLAGKSGELANGELQSTGARWVDVYARLELGKGM